MPDARAEGPLAGIRVLEVANWLAAPAGCALLADAGADVIKVEPPTGDVYRGYVARAASATIPYNYAFELDNRGKRGITLDLEKPEARELVYRLIPKCDVFVTNLLAGRRERYGLTYEELSAHRPDLIFVSVTGYGSWGPDKDRPGYDYAAYWARSGIMNLLGEPDSPPPPQRPGMGDHTTALAVSGAVSMALFNRQRSGKGEQIDISLNNTGMWVLAIDVQSALSTGQENVRVSRRSVPNPIWNSYQTGDGRWIQLVMLVADIYWPKVCRAIDRTDLEMDPRFDSMPKRTENREELILVLDGVFAGKPSPNGPLCSTARAASGRQHRRSPRRLNIHRRSLARPSPRSTIRRMDPSGSSTRPSSSARPASERAALRRS